MDQTAATTIIKCPHFPRCGGCQSLSTEYHAQLLAKQRQLDSLFRKWPDIRISPVIPSPQVCFYRHKVQLPFGHKGTGKRFRVTLGCYGTDSHEVVDQHECLVQDRDLSAVAWAVRSWANSMRLTAYNESRHDGFLRHVLLRKGAGTGEILVGLVTNGEPPPGTRRLATALLETASPALKSGTARIVGIVQNVNTRRTNVVLGPNEVVWWGRPYLKEMLGPWRFKLGITTFFQVNPYQTPRLYDEVARWVPQGAHLLDIYCGVGSIALWLSPKCHEVVGIEENLASVHAAREAVRLNKVRNVRFVTGDAADVVPARAGSGFDVAIVDPPRKGLEEPVARALADAGLKRLIYVSCNPESLVRDMEVLGRSLKLTHVQGFDMFPHTGHVECVAVLDTR